MLSIVLNVIALTLVAIDHSEATLTLALAGCVSLISGGILWSYGVRIWAARDFFIGVLGVASAILLELFS